MPISKLSPDQKEDKKARDNLLILHNGIRSDWSNKRIITWRHLYRKLGYADEVIDSKGVPEYVESEKMMTFPELKQVLEKQQQALEDKIRKKYEVKAEDKTTVNGNNNLEKVFDKVSQEVSSTRTERVTQENIVTIKESKEVILNLENDYGFIPSPNEPKTFSALWYQKRAISEILQKVKAGLSGILVLSATGTGKTIMALGTVRRLKDECYEEGKTWSHIPYLYIGKTTILDQIKQDAIDMFGIDCSHELEVINIEQLRSKAGQLWVKEVISVKDGLDESNWEWKPKINPCVVLFDESQGAKNIKSTQSQIMCAYSKLKNACLISISATPFTRVSEAKCFAISTKRSIEHMGFPAGSILNEDNWPQYARMISAPSKPDDYNEAAVGRLMKDLDKYVVRVRGVRPQFNAKNGVKVIPFESIEKREFYLDAWKRFESEMAAIKAAEEAGEPQAANCHLVVLQKFSMAAEMCHAEGFADRMYKHVYKEGKAAICAVKWKGTIIEIVKILNQKYCVPRDMISLIWGGGQTQLTDKQKEKQKVRAMQKKIEKAGFSMDEMLADLDLDEVEDRVLQDLPEHLRLGPQDKAARKKEIDSFQRGKTLFCVYTFRAGGVGLSLPHTDRFTEFKCRRKESGYVYEEDILKVPTRPRKGTIATTYNAIELAQGIGRAPRIVSLSDTEQDVICYEGTIEMEMAHIYSKKFRCLSAVVAQREDWQDVILGAASGKDKAKIVNDALEKTERTPDDDGTLIGDVSEDDD